MFLQKILSIIRGKYYRVYYKTINKDIFIGKNVRIGKNVFLSARNGGKVIIGDRVVIGGGSDISALNGGQITIGDDVGIGNSNRIISHEEITIGNNTLLAPNVSIYDHDHLFDKNGVKRLEYKTGTVSIGENCWICINSVVLKSTCLGNNCLVGACSIINGTFENNSRIVQKRVTNIEIMK